MNFLCKIVCLALCLFSCFHSKAEKTILLVSGWQDVNIGDIAHTPGLIHVLNRFVPEANVILWEKSTSDYVDELIQKHYPQVNIIHGKIDENLNIDNQEVYEAFDKADIMIHGSGPSVVGLPHLEAWLKHTKGKPFGIFGVTVEKMDDRLKNVLSKASFVYTRETQSLDFLRKHGITGPTVAFAPDATFYLDIRDEQKTKEFLYENRLKPKEYICVIPRLRITPYYKIANRQAWSMNRVMEIEQYNNVYKQEEHAKLRNCIVEWVRKTGKKVVVCPEMTYQVDIMDELLVDSLPFDVKPYVVKHGYWMPDEAASLYSQACVVLSMDCHSPIIACANGTPFFYFRQPEDTSKGQMYYDLKFQDWIFNIAEVGSGSIISSLFEVTNNYDSATEHIACEMNAITEIYRNACDIIRMLLKL